ncbi:SNF1- protein kinase catalytic subunit alpha kin10 [Turnera subulata]|uniref:non-specific serine/threonine protein kinase n=1 Tax=Turnera subulata TaxID=218843 RepID=A0A9Q0JJK7_9ROSI|nr:SNF1- protein kinase catalytic subunit alpha kin10 [Turnera subulata]
MEYAKFGDLFDYIVVKGSLPEDEARKVFQQIISALAYCHTSMIVHRDLKPDNILLDSKCNVKLADFGFSNTLQDGHFLKTSCGSYNYAAPEVISGKWYAGPEVDVWSCGVILYALLCGTLPFDDENIPNLLRKIQGGKYSLKRITSPGARDLISRMLVVDPLKRLTIPEICQHPWFQRCLAPYLAVPLPQLLQQAQKIDEAILQQVIKMGFDPNQVIECIQNRKQTQATVAYYLLLDNRPNVLGTYTRAQLEGISENASYNILTNQLPSPATGHHLQSCTELYGGTSSKLQSAANRKWALGLQSRARPQEIMMVVLTALHELTVCWKKIGHYNMKCRWIPGTAGYRESSMLTDPVHSIGNQHSIIETDEAIASANVVKFEVQLYKARDEKYLLDLQRVQGPQFLFLDLCAALLAQLQVI